MSQTQTFRGTHWIVPLLISGVSLLIHWTEPRASEFLSYQREAIAHGEFWRILSGHFCHLGSTHLTLNLLGLWLISLLFMQTLTPSTMLTILLGSMLGCSAGLWCLTPYVSSYVGLSGALHGLMVGSALLDLNQHRFTNALLLTGVLAKVIWENSAYYTDTTSQLIGGHVLVQSHLFGAISGGITACLILFYAGLHIKKYKMSA